MSMIGSAIEQHLKQSLITKLSDEDTKAWIQKYATPFRQLMSYYRCAIMEVETKFRVLSEEMSLEYDRNPIETIKTRLKSPESILGKIHRKGLPLDVSAIEEHICDISGVRVICSFQSDIYMLANAFLNQDDITLVEKKDYIKSPKPNGYRSLHLIVQIPIFLHDQKKLMKVEVQFRTISMDWWASLEHKICYKKDLAFYNQIKKELLECATMADDLDRRMESVYKLTEKNTEDITE